MSTQTDSPSGVRVEEVGEVTVEILGAMEELADRMARSRHTSPTREQLEEIAASPTTHLLVARDETGMIAGTLTLAMYRLPSGPRAWIEDVAVLMFAGGKGLGRALVEEAFVLAREAGLKKVELLVDPANTPAMHLFERRGFRRMATGLAYEAHL